MYDAPGKLSRMPMTNGVAGGALAYDALPAWRRLVLRLLASALAPCAAALVAAPSDADDDQQDEESER
jgi:hypothetical protein